MNVFIAMLAEHIHWIIVIFVAIVAGLVVLTHKITRFIDASRTNTRDIETLKEKWERDIPEMKKMLQALTSAVASLDKRMDSMEKRMDAFEKRMDSMEKRMDKRMDSLDDRVRALEVTNGRIALVFEKLYPQATPRQTNSPVTLTKTGERIVEAINAREFIKEHEKELKALVEKEQPRTPYDLQEACLNIVWKKWFTEMMPLSMLDDAKMFSFQHGTPLDMVLSVIGILLRDEMFRERGWPVPKPKSAPQDEQDTQDAQDSVPDRP